MCQGYYRHSEGYTPEWDGMETFKGRIVHPQTWPEDLDYTGKKVVVIGSGATAATLVPAIAGDCAHVTMLQRSPTYFLTGRNAIALAEELRELQIDEDLDPRDRAPEDPARPGRVHQPVVHRTGGGEAGTAGGWCARISAPDYDVEDAFHADATGRGGSASPSFRTAICSRASASGKASVVTDEIERFTETGIQLKSGKALEADIIVTATGFNLSVLGDIAFSIDGEAAGISPTP